MSAICMYIAAAVITNNSYQFYIKTSIDGSNKLDYAEIYVMQLVDIKK